MSNPFYSATGNPMSSMLNQLKSNPVQFLMHRKFNIPSDMTDPNDILNHLVSSGQVDQNAVNRAYQMAQRFK